MAGSKPDKINLNFYCRDSTNLMKACNLFSYVGIYTSFPFIIPSHNTQHTLTHYLILDLALGSFSSISNARSTAWR
ncbi:hypothetical protein EUGRSUZ_C02781 [Eucalyptus grandis]|uniref:Uncharacterized protein n=2 Tax=Eucalyptus grandis TaxID=71139 RepID=A0ACC3LIE9_EUCGR|nr:hypothetical protein EUGRSUZ_C02781 [Eucalyptus grandis]